MLFGHNTNVTLGDITYHVQTEDRGVNTALIDTTVYHRGRVTHRRTNNYFDLLPLDEQREQLLKLRLDEQHLSVLREIRSGALQLASMFPPSTPAKSPGSAGTAGAVTLQPSDAQVPISLELSNAKTWLAAKHATLQLQVRQKENGNAIAGAQVFARIDGAAEQSSHFAATGADGRVTLEFDMPRLTGAEPALVIEAKYGGAQAHLRYQLRAKPKVSATP